MIAIMVVVQISVVPGSGPLQIPHAEHIADVASLVGDGLIRRGLPLQIKETQEDPQLRVPRRVVFADQHLAILSRRRPDLVTPDVRSRIERFARLFEDVLESRIVAQALEVLVRTDQLGVAESEFHSLFQRHQRLILPIQSRQDARQVVVTLEVMRYAPNRLRSTGSASR